MYHINLGKVIGLVIVLWMIQWMWGFPDNPIDTERAQLFIVLWWVYGLFIV